jgi:Protein of unknown function (DUF2637)/Family of unknown function (DUF6212)
VTGGRAIRWSTVAAVAGVAIVAGWVSYLHAYDVVAAHGEHGILARLYPGTIDGLIYAASMVLLDAARRAVQPPRLARWLLSAGIGATLFANVLAGAAYGVLGAAVAAWPAAALVGSYELLMWLVRQGVTAAPQAAPDVPGPHLNGSGLHPAEAQPFAAELARGEVPSIRRIRAELHVGQPRAQEVQARLAVLASTP